MLVLHWACVDSKVNKIKGIFNTIMLAPLFFTNSFGMYGKNERKYSRHSMLDFPLFMTVSSFDYYLSMRGNRRNTMLDHPIF